MITRDSGARRPPRSSLHAVQFPGVSPAAVHARRALRLFVTAGTWAAGLCLVVGSIVLVAATAGRSTETGQDAASRSSGLPIGAPLPALGVRVPAGLASYREVATFTGRGDKVTGRFRIRADARWQLRWSFRCPAGSRHGHLTVADAAIGVRGAITLGAAITKLGAGGHGRTWRHASRGSHELVVLSSCTWTMKVVQAR